MSTARRICNTARTAQFLEFAMHPTLIAALLMLGVTTASAATPNMQPGLYDISMQFVLNGMPIQMPITTFQQCITAQDVTNGMAYASSENKDCTISNLNQIDNKVSYDFNCAAQPGGPRMIGRASGISHASGYTVMMKGRFNPAVEGMSEFSQKLNARRLGNCSK